MSEEVKYTPGPWSLFRREVDGLPMVISPHEPLCVCNVTDYGAMPADANGALIAAALDLLAVAKAYEQWEADLVLSDAAWRDGQALPRLTNELWSRLLEIQTMRNKAIAKANGTTT